MTRLDSETWEKYRNTDDGEALARSSAMFLGSQEGGCMRGCGAFIRPSVRYATFLTFVPQRWYLNVPYVL